MPRVRASAAEERAWVECYSAVLAAEWCRLPLERAPTRAEKERCEAEAAASADRVIGEHWRKRFER